MLIIVGYTTEKKEVLAGVFKMTETHGIPLDILLEGIRDKGALPCWISYYKEARRAGMKHERILARLEEALQDVYGQQFKDHVIQTLEKVHESGSLYP